MSLICSVGIVSSQKSIQTGLCYSYSYHSLLSLSSTMGEHQVKQKEIHNMKIGRGVHVSKLRAVNKESADDRASEIVKDVDIVKETALLL